MAAGYAPTALDERALRARVSQLEDDLTKVRAEIAQLEQRRDRYEAELGELAGLVPADPEMDGVRDVGEQARPLTLIGAVHTNGAKVGGVDATRAERKAAVFGVFSLPELAIAAGLDLKGLKKWAKDREASGLLAPAGKVGKDVIYEWKGEVVEEEVEYVDLPPERPRITVDLERDEVRVEREPPAVDIKGQADREEEARRWKESPEARQVEEALNEIDVEAGIRKWVETRGKEFAQSEIVETTGLEEGAVENALGKLARYGIIRDVGVPGFELFEFVSPDARPRARPSAEARKAEPAVRAGPVAGTGKHHESNLTISHPETRALVHAIQAAGGEVSHAAGGHLEVKFEGGRCLISSTPSSNRSVMSDRARVRRLGLGLTG